MTVTILVVEDEPTQRLMVSRALQKNGSYLAQTAANGKEALFFLSRSKSENDIQLVLMDIEMPEMSGLEALKQIKRLYPNLPVIMLSGTENQDEVVQAMKIGAIDFLSKPVDLQHLEVAVTNALKLATLNQEVSRLRRKTAGAVLFDDLVGVKAGLAGIVKMARKAALADLPVLIQGETGVGKELMARAIHGESLRAGKPFVAINCGAIPEKLVESTLFGHEKGAFIGATESSLGKFREADGGTIFLDEVGELPLEAQVKLLRALQQQEVEAVGGKKPIPIDVRIISATNRALQEEIMTQSFREDLFFRLNVLPLTLPPLRERKQDIPSLVQLFRQSFLVQHDIENVTFTPEAFAKLAEYPWPGNVRQLQNTVHRLIVMAEQNEVSAEEVQHVCEMDVMSTVQENSVTSSAGMCSFLDASGRLKTLEEMEQEIMHYALQHCGGNVTKASEAIGVAKSTFYRRYSSRT